MTLKILGGSMVEAVDEAHMAGVVLQALITDMISLSEAVEGVTLNATSLEVEEEVKILLEAGENSGMVMIIIVRTEILEIDREMAKVILIGDVDGIITEVEVIVKGAEEGVGIPIPITHSRITNNNINTQIPIIIVHLQWVISTDIKYPMNKILDTRHSLPNTSRNRGEHNPNKLQIYVNCVIIRVIMIINANLQATLWREHRKPLIKGDLTVTKMQIKVTGLMGKMITMTQTASLFSKGGSRCC